MEENKHDSESINVVPQEPVVTGDNPTANKVLSDVFKLFKDGEIEGLHLSGSKRFNNSSDIKFFLQMPDKRIIVVVLEGVQDLALGEVVTVEGVNTSADDGPIFTTAKKGIS